MALPSGYKRVEYIQSSGTQYINSLFTPNQNTRCVTVFASTYIPEGLGENLPIYGSAKSYDSNAYEFWLTGKGWCCFGSQAYKNDFGLVANTQYVSDQNKNILTVAGNTYTFNASTFTAPHSLLLLASYRTNGGVIAGDPKAKVNLYSCQIYDNGTLVRDYIPCQNASGGVGLWDEVEGKFYANAGTGEFIAGPEIAREPSAPTGLHVVSETDTSVEFSWNAVEDALGYRVYQSGELVADQTENSFTAEIQPFGYYTFEVTAYNENGEGKAATLIVYNRPENPVLWLVTDRTQSDVTARNEKGTYNVSDLNRVGAAMKYVADRFAEYGYAVSITPRTDWLENEWVTPAAAEVYLGSLTELRQMLSVMQATPEVPEDLERMTYQEANNIEKILEDIDFLLSQSAKTWFFSGDLFSGEV